MAEPENAILRNALRTIAVHSQKGIEDSDGGNSDMVEHIEAAQAALVAVRDLANETLKRPLTNDRVIDDLQRQVGDLSSKLVDMQLLRAENATLQFKADEATRQMRIAYEQLEAVRAASRPAIARAASPRDGGAKYLVELGAKLRQWSEDGMIIGAHRAAELEEELQEIAASLDAQLENDLEAQAVATAADRERLLYWLCRSWAALRSASNLDPLLDAVLTEFGYSSPEDRIAMIKHGEPGTRPAPTRCSVCRMKCAELDLAAIDAAFCWMDPSSAPGAYKTWPPGDPRNATHHAYLDHDPLCDSKEDSDV